MTYAVAPLTVNNAAITNFESAASDGVTALRESLTNLIGIFGIIAIALVIMAFVIKAFKSPAKVLDAGGKLFFEGKYYDPDDVPLAYYDMKEFKRVQKLEASGHSSYTGNEKNEI